MYRFGFQNTADAFFFYLFIFLIQQGKFMNVVAIQTLSQALCTLNSPQQQQQQKKKSKKQNEQKKQ